MSADERNSDPTNVIDAAIARAQARAKQRDENASETSVRGSQAGRAKLTDEERAARDAKREADKATKKADKLRNKQEKQAQKNASKQAPHQAKVDKAASKLPSLDEKAQLLYNEATVSLARDQVNAVAQHLLHFNRAQATARALTQKLTVGAQVRVTSGDARYLGMVGTVAKAQRIRCYLSIDGVKKDVYMFSSDVELVSSEEATGTNG